MKEQEVVHHNVIDIINYNMLKKIVSNKLNRVL